MRRKWKDFDRDRYLDKVRMVDWKELYAEKIQNWQIPFLRRL